MDEITQQIYNEMKENFKTETGVEVKDISNIAINFKIIADKLSKLQLQINEDKKQMFPTTATGEYLTMFGEEQGVPRKVAKAATGEVTFFKTDIAPTDIIIPKNTLVGISSNGSMAFETTEEVKIKIGEHLSLATVTCLSKGTCTNISKNKIDVMITPVLGVDKVYNTYDFYGGCDEENDEIFKKRLLESYRKAYAINNLTYIENMAIKNEYVSFAKAYYIQSSNNVELYVDNTEHNLTSSVITALQENVTENAPVNVAVTVKKPTVKAIDIEATVKLKSLSEKLSVNTVLHPIAKRYIASLSIGEAIKPSVLAKEILKIPQITDVIFTKPTDFSLGKSEIISLNSMLVAYEKE